jgi:hypothetical protein
LKDAEDLVQEIGSNVRVIYNGRIYQLSELDAMRASGKAGNVPVAEILQNGEYQYSETIDSEIIKQTVSDKVQELGRRRENAGTKQEKQQLDSQLKILGVAGNYDGPAIDAFRVGVLLTLGDRNVNNIIATHGNEAIQNGEKATRQALEAMNMPPEEIENVIKLARSANIAELSRKGLEKTGLDKTFFGENYEQALNDLYGTGLENFIKKYGGGGLIAALLVLASGMMDVKNELIPSQ